MAVRHLKNVRYSLRTEDLLKFVCYEFYPTFCFAISYKTVM